ncbi:MAG: M20/M25/M40 family metallo-hydrolase [Gemmatimonadetes bacterium]|nr:M20/M25/M40 family metallo-hydrolase [Gemmatimonadota bacterium]MCC6770344.1 M20/M25/M40 family metallo-hydrolase [Gemmatimonadaceae bacterium]
MSASTGAVRRVYDALLPARRHLLARDAQTIDRQVSLAEIAAPSGHEATRAGAVQRHLRRLGLPATIDAAGNVIAERRGSADEPPVVVCAHLDTVFNEDLSHHVTRTSDRLIGPGIGDNARGITGMLAIAEALDAGQVRTRHPILFVATTGEEGCGNLRGARHLFASVAAEAHAAIALDGAGDERIVTHALGIRRFRISYAGPGGHSWASYGTVNAIHAAAALTARVAEWPLAGAPRTVLTVSRIGGGSAINAIPSEAWMEIDLRSTSSAEIDRLDAEIRVAAGQVLAAHNRQRRHGSALLQLSLEVIGDRPGGALAGNAFLGQAAFDATRLVGRTPESAVASTDANIPLHLGIPAIAVGAGGRGGDVHTSREWFENRDGVLGLVRAMTVLVATAELA